MSKLIVTLDIDWACESAIEQTLDFFLQRGVTPTVFTTHHSACVKERLNDMEVGLHPFFDPYSSQGSTVAQVVDYVMGLPHNLPAFRCHRFACSNTSKQAMVEAGMQISSNVCSDLEIVDPFKDRFGLLEIPIFLEDGGYLWRKHPLEISQQMKDKLLGPGIKVLLIHPMHFVINSPDFNYMYKIKQSMSRQMWQGMSGKELKGLEYQGRGIRHLLLEILHLFPQIDRLSSLL